jgi:transcriptional regulator of nitric oxide reductase
MPNAECVADYNSDSGGSVLQRAVSLAALIVGAATLVLAGGQAGAIDAKQQARLKLLFPAAASFSPKQGEPPHYTASAGEGDARAVLGYAFWTTDVELIERGYGGPIAMLVGIDLKGILTGLVVVSHHEPYGNFSIEPPAFAAQFKGKDVRDPFKLGGDVDAVSRATITMSSAVRAIRNASRAIARALLAPPGADR